MANVVKFKTDYQKKMMLRLFRTRIREYRIATQGISYYYKSMDFNIQQTKEFYLDMLKGFNISEEFYDAHWPQFFILVNKNSNVTNDPASEEFIDLVNKVMNLSCNIKNVGSFL